MSTSSPKKHKSRPNKRQLQKQTALSWIWQGFFDKISLLRGLILAQADEPKMKSLLIVKKTELTARFWNEAIDKTLREPK
jgi:hypothetical protein